MCLVIPSYISCFFVLISKISSSAILVLTCHNAERRVNSLTVQSQGSKDYHGSSVGEYLTNSINRTQSATSALHVNLFDFVIQSKTS